MTIDGNALLALATISAAAIAGGFSLLSLIISKDQQVSEFRQRWTDELRRDLSEYVSAANAYVQMRRNAIITNSEEEWRKFIVDSRPDVLEMARTHTLTQLRLNPDDPDPMARAENLALLEALVDGHELRTSRDVSTLDHAKADIARLRAVAQPVLKRAWERVKSGESTYRRAKGFATVLFGLALISALAGAGYFLLSQPEDAAGVVGPAIQAGPATAPPNKLLESDTATPGR